MNHAPIIAPIVEGYGEVAAVRQLITRIGEQSGVYVEVAQPFRLDSGKMRKPEELAKAVRLQEVRVRGRVGGVLIVRDGDDGDIQCPVELARRIAPEPGASSVPVEVVIAYHEYEAWFLAAVESLRGHPSVRDDATTPQDPEARRSAKKQLELMMNESYKETLHQAKFSSLIDLSVASSNSRSFRRMVHAVEKLIT
ncbi:DUF4276 family protein [Streptomyces xanthophaeus]|uniref:DUF4276 family protein n=1 Tax=Streptomyces xanthophaeus TaxID=67385 RepID=UPI00099D608B|nr:DUF4276 family protein [Streptomyces xanthophaeus]